MDLIFFGYPTKRQWLQHQKKGKSAGGRRRLKLFILSVDDSLPCGQSRMYPAGRIACGGANQVSIVCWKIYECFNVNLDNCFQIVSRKGKAEERRPLLILFSADAMACMFHAAGVASEKALDEKHYLFLKKLTQVNKTRSYADVSEADFYPKYLFNY